MTKPLCIYHGGCDDGFAAAWCVRKVLGDDVEFYPGVYQKEPPPHDGRDVIFVDFSYKRPVLETMARAANSILILDHHKTAQEDLADLPHAPSFDHWRRVAWNFDGSVGALSHLPAADRNIPIGKDRYGSAFVARFDMERSGAALAWDYFIGDGAWLNWHISEAIQRRAFVDYIQDRDLWRKELVNGDEFTIALRSYPQDFAIWNRLIEAGPEALIEEGRAIQRYYRLRVEELKRSAYPATFDFFGPDDMTIRVRAMVANAPYFAASEVAGELSAADGFDCGACYFEVEKGRFQYSLRSRGDFDVSAVARIWGGGGHKNAAGFTVAAPVHRRAA